jgi:DNA-binding NtrC family response regulator
VPANSLRRTLLLVDDDALLRRALEDALAGDSLDVLCAATGAEALAICSSRRVDVVVLDQKLPDTEGHRLCAPILQANERAKIIFITAYPTFDNAVQAIQAGAFEYLSKPFEVGALELAIQRSLATLRLERTERLHQDQRRAESRASVLVGAEGGLREVAGLADLAADSDAPVLITGETGTGKSLVARCIHFKSGRSRGEFLTLNCAALPDGLIEAELFGHEKGAFTGAHAAREGLFELADGGTLLLDEIGEMPAGLQSKLLNVLEEKTVRRVGSRMTRRVDFRLVAATNAELEAAVAGRTFRADLFYRLDVVRIHVPPLRERREDIPGLCAHVLAKLGARDAGGIAASEMARLLKYPWPGNVRELRNVLERAMLLQRGTLRPSELLGAPRAARAEPAAPAERLLSLAELERRQIDLALSHTRGNLAQAARCLGISLSTLKRRVRAHAIAPARARASAPHALIP